jgi:selenide,water dikinase
VYSAALKKSKLDAADYTQMIASTTQLNTPGRRLAQLPGVHALTDVTGFGLLGHLLELCRGSCLRADVRFEDVPLLPAAVALATQGFVTGASARNWAGYGRDVTLQDAMDVERALLTDPQTSGGLLTACDRQSAESVLAIFHEEGFPHAAVIGSLSEGAPQVHVT